MQLQSWGEVPHSWQQRTNLVSTLTIVIYQGKPVSLPPEISPHGMTFDMF